MAVSRGARAGHQADVRHQPALAAGKAIDIGRRVEDSGVGLFWLEDVTTHDDYAGIARVNAALATPICGGELVYGIVRSAT